MNQVFQRVDDACAHAVCEAIAAAHKRGETIAILTHGNPDYDAVATSIVVRELVKAICGQEAQIYYHGEVVLGLHDRFKGLNLKRLCEVLVPFLIVVDCHNTKSAHVRGPHAIASLPQAGIIIDHHVVLKDEHLEGALSVIDATASAAVIIALEILSYFRGGVDKPEIAPFVRRNEVAIALGVWTDIGREVLERITNDQLPERARPFLHCMGDVNNDPALAEIANRCNTEFETARRSAEATIRWDEFRNGKIARAHVGLLNPSASFAAAMVAQWVVHQLGGAASMITYMLPVGEVRAAFRTCGEFSAAALAQSVFGESPDGLARAGGHRQSAGGTLSLVDTFPEPSQRLSQDRLRQLGLVYADIYGEHFTGRFLEREVQS